ncbi:hypothetical protein FP263_26165, partial [Salmonella enterica subsp. enterica]|nr:hypothetical protein [Salmonella enterica subsp. enterica serovar Newport]
MRYLLLTLSLMGGFLSFNSFAKDSCPVISVPFKYDPFLTHYVPSNSSHPEYGSLPALDIHGCTYVITSNSCPDNVDLSQSGSVCIATSLVLLSDKGDDDSPIQKPDNETDKPNPSPDTPDTKPDNPDTGGSGSGGGSSGGGTTVIPPAPDTGSSGGS